jgi:hypothetical protein
MEKMLIQERFKSPDKVFEKVYGIFDKRDYFNAKGLAKVQIGNFERALQKNDKGAQQILDKFKGDEKKAKEYIIQVIHDRKKEQAFEDFKAFKSAVNKLEMVSKGKSKDAYGASDLVKSRAHNNSQKYTMALYSAIRKQKFNNYKDVHKDVDDLLAKNEGFSSDAQRKAAFANGYEEKGKKKNESVNEAYIVLHSPKKGVKPVATAAYRDKKDAEKWAKDLGGITMIVKKKMRGVDEGKKRFKRQDGIGKAKYTISFHDGRKKHKDGSDFFDIKIFKNKKDLSNFVGTLVKKGYKLTNESINEILVIVDKFDKRKQDYDKVYYQDGGKRPGDGDINKAQKEFDKLSKKHKGLTLISVDRNSKMYDVNESINEEVPQGYNPMVEDKSEITKLVKKVNKSETKFYDVLSVMEKKYGKNKYRIWLEKSLKDFGVNPKHYDYRTNAAAEEKLFQLGK